jgi:peptide-methionine (S)-S-oxide reductase
MLKRLSVRVVGPVGLFAAIAFAAAPLQAQPAAATGVAATRDTVVFAGGCFWGVQAVFARVRGVVSSISGYAGGTAVRPSYEEVSTGTTGHAESVRVIYDPAKVTFDQLLEVFFSVAHDPTELNRQGPDHGTQYRSAVFFNNAVQQQAINAFIAKLTQTKVYPHPIVTQVAALRAFYPAEDYHQNYFDLHPDQDYIVINDKPKVEHLKQQFPQLYTGK